MPQTSPPNPIFTVVDARFVLGIADPSPVPASDLPQIAFAGRSNVGKSSLLNALTSRKSLARTSSTPGCTRQINVFDVRLGDGLELRLVDLPGFGYAKRSKQERIRWGELIEHYLAHAPLMALVLLVDVRRGLEDEELQLIEFMRGVRDASFPCVVVLTKADKVSRSEAQRMLARARPAVGRSVLAFSAQTGAGRQELWSELRKLAGGVRRVPDEPRQDRPASG